MHTYIYIYMYISILFYCYIVIQKAGPTCVTALLPSMRVGVAIGVLAGVMLRGRLRGFRGLRFWGSGV